jgi:tRNA-Thr(GGU) m(6)t(6)A37 methyltransferase TsaA
MSTEVQELAARWFQAWLDKDAEAIERLVADDYVYVGPNGTVLDRQAILAIIRSPSYRLDRGTRSEVVVRVLGPDAAMVRHRYEGAGAFEGAEFVDDQRCVMVWERQAGRWRLVMEQCALNGVPPVDAALRPIGVIRSTLDSRDDAPKQGSEGAPEAWLEVAPWAAGGLLGIEAGDELIVITWLHQGDRGTLQVHPRDNPRNPLTGVFATRSSDRPNPLGLHPVTVSAIEGNRLRIGPIEAIDGTPVVDIKPVLK